MRHVRRVKYTLFMISSLVGQLQRAGKPALLFAALPSKYRRAFLCVVDDQGRVCEKRHASNDANDSPISD